MLTEEMQMKDLVLQEKERENKLLSLKLKEALRDKQPHEEYRVDTGKQTVKLQEIKNINEKYTKVLPAHTRVKSLQIETQPKQRNNSKQTLQSVRVGEQKAKLESSPTEA